MGPVSQGSAPGVGASAAGGVTGREAGGRDAPVRAPPAPLATAWPPAVRGSTGGGANGWGEVTHDASSAGSVSWLGRRPAAMPAFASVASAGRGPADAAADLDPEGAPRAGSAFPPAGGGSAMGCPVSSRGAFLGVPEAADAGAGTAAGPLAAAETGAGATVPGRGVAKGRAAGGAPVAGARADAGLLGAGSGTDPVGARLGAVTVVRRGAGSGTDPVPAGDVAAVRGAGSGRLAGVRTAAGGAAGRGVAGGGAAAAAGEAAAIWTWITLPQWQR